MRGKENLKKSFSEYFCKLKKKQEKGTVYTHWNTKELQFSVLLDPYWGFAAQALFLILYTQFTIIQKMVI